MQEHLFVEKDLYPYITLAYTTAEMCVSPPVTKCTFVFSMHCLSSDTVTCTTTSGYYF